MHALEECETPNSFLGGIKGCLDFDTTVVDGDLCRSYTKDSYTGFGVIATRKHRTMLSHKQKGCKCNSFQNRFDHAFSKFREMWIKVMGR